MFAAWADPEAVRQWGSPSDDVTLRHEAADFRVGGEDVTICVVAGEPAFRVRARYHDILPDRRIVFTEAIEEWGGQRLGASLVSAEMAPTGRERACASPSSRRRFDGSGFEADVGTGWSASLDGLGRLLGAPAAA